MTDSAEDIIQRCQKVVENELFCSKTNLIYDYRETLDHEHRFDHLPTVEEIAQCLPNPCGWASGMEDGMINTPIMLSAYLDSDNPEWAYKCFQGMKLCGTVSGVPGAVVRSVHPVSGKFYPESSRDQYTHYVYGLWDYYNSPYSDKTTKEEITKLLTDVADYCEKCITPENNYTLNRADNGHPRSSVCKLWNVAPHEAARLPMFYAAAYLVSGDKHYWGLYQKYALDAAEQSTHLGERSYHCYALFQMLCSCRLIYEADSDPTIRNLYLKAMKNLYEYTPFNILRCADARYRADLYAAHGTWRGVTKCLVLPGCRHIIPEAPEAYLTANRIPREMGESLLIGMMKAPHITEFTDMQKRCFHFIIKDFEPEKYHGYGILYLVAAWHKAKKLGIEF